MVLRILLSLQIVSLLLAVAARCVSVLIGRSMLMTSLVERVGIWTACTTVMKRLLTGCVTLSAGQMWVRPTCVRLSSLLASIPSLLVLRGMVSKLNRSAAPVLLGNRPLMVWVLRPLATRRRARIPSPMPRVTRLWPCAGLESVWRGSCGLIPGFPIVWTRWADPEEKHVYVSCRNIIIFPHARLGSEETDVDVMFVSVLLCFS